MHPSDSAERSDPAGSGAVPPIDDLTVVVVDWNLPDHTIRCVRALLEDGVPAARVVVVENGPTADSWARISTELSSNILVHVETNVGFAAANNIGARVLPGRAYLLVNNDAFVHAPGSVGRLLAALGDDRVGVVVPRLLNEDLTLQPTVSPFTTPVTALVRASGLSRFVPDPWKPTLTTHWDHGSSREVDQAIGAVMLVEGRLWEALGGLRETSFMYAEDLDLCWRAHEHALRTWFVAEAEFVHVGGASSSSRWASRERAARIGQAEAGMIREHLSPPRAAVTLAFIRAGLGARVVCFNALGRRDAAETCRGFLAGYGASPDPAPASPGEPRVEVVWPAESVSA